LNNLIVPSGSLRESQISKMKNEDSREFKSGIPLSLKKTLSPKKKISYTKSPDKNLNNWLQSPKKMKIKNNTINADESILNLKKSEIELENKYILRNSNSLSKLLLRDECDENRKDKLEIFRSLRNSNIFLK
jgi:hypothetical protein